MPAIYVNDAGTWRKIRNVYVNDAGTWRSIKKAYVNDAGTWRQVFSAQDDLSIIAGHSALLGGADGYSTNTPVIGSISGATLGDGKTVTKLMTFHSVEEVVLALQISGFSSDPGQNYLVSLDAYIANVLGQFASLYSYSSGSATWQWNDVTSVFTAGSTYPIAIVRS